MRKLILLALAALLSVTLWGCGSSRDSSSISGSTEGSLADAEILGITNCLTCHSLNSGVADAWYMSNAHGNKNNLPNSTFFGNPTPEDCAVCHDALGDGELLTIAAVKDSAGVDVFNRPVVGCESCHGGGQFHNGIPGGIPIPRPDWEQCVQCHDLNENTNPHGDYALASAVGASAHNNADDLHASSATCQRCHTVEGSYQLTAYTGDFNVMFLMNSLDPIDTEANLHPVTCAACHVPHTDALRADTFIENENSLVNGGAPTDWDPNGSGTADQFDYCTSCHTFYNQDDVLTASGTVASGTAPFYHSKDWYRIIATTHYDDPATGVGLAENIVEGYVIRDDSADPCFDCHGHELRTNTRHSQDVPGTGDNLADFGYTIHTEWASSGHAGGLLNEKYAADTGVRSEDNVDAVMAAGASDASSNGGFTHYNWDDNSNFASCGQKCHTATGFKNYAADPTGYDPATTPNEYPHLSGWNTVGGSPQNELLYCWGCHSSAQTGALEVDFAVTVDYQVDGVDVVFPDVGSSNTCVVCHSGLDNNETVSISSRFAGHHAPAAATLYSELTNVAYQYPGLDYGDPVFFAHDTIGRNNDSPETGTGPCVSCHMGDVAAHTFAVVEKNASGVITEIVTQALCNTCHTPGGTFEMTAAIVESESEEYQDAGLLINDIINQANGLTNYTGATITQGNGPDNDKGAFQNAKLPVEEKGGFAHNRFYVKRAIFDAIDWAEDGAIDGTITDYTGAGTVPGYTGAMIWLGTTRP